MNVHFAMSMTMLTVLLAFVAPGTSDAGGSISTQTLFQAGQGGYHTYRIPALLVTPRGTVLAFCEGRKTGPEDHGDVDLLAKRSSDGGRTWSPQQIVHEEGGNAKITIGNPCPVVDETTGTIWLPFTRDNKAVFVTSSTDEGKTWTAPRNISATTMKPDWDWVATGPGIGIQLTRGPHKGRLLIPSDHRRTLSDNTNELNSHMMFSDDGGRSWQIGAPIQSGGNECQVIERPDGSLLVNTRMEGDFRGIRGIATSTDGGATWSALAQEKQLPCPKCQGSLIRYSWPDASGPGRLLFSNPHPSPGTGNEKKLPRVNLTVRLSTDDGRTWPVAKLLHEGPSAYSSLARLPDGTILCLYEGGGKTFRDFLRLARFDLQWLLGKPGSSSPPNTKNTPKPRAKPNIIFIMADDLGYTDVACFGSKYYETPNIDRLAAQGMRLTNYHQCQNCTPTRAALMSGQHGARTGLYTVGGIDRFNWQSRPLRPVDNVTNLPLDRDIIAQQLKAAGYVTGMFGKWHIGEQGPYHPGQRGFDEAIVSAGVHFDFATSPKTDYPKGRYLADFLTDRAVDFITRHKDKPFFLYLPHFAVHSPHQAKPELIEKFKPKAGVGGHNNPTYAAMIYSVDESVGRVMKTLDDLRLADHTVLIFTSDNGGVGGYVREGIKKAGDVTDNAPLRSGKGSLYEGGTRDPFIVRWPGVTRSGSTCDVPTVHVDIFPTLLEIAAAPKPRQVLDGESLVKLFRDPAAQLQRDAIFQHFPGYLGAGEGSWRTTPVSLIQSGDWKLMEFLEDGRLELYNLREDIGESKNLAKAMPDKAKELYARLVAWRTEVGAPMPTKNDGSAATPKEKGKGKKKNRNESEG